MAEFLRRELDLKDGEPSEYFLRWMLKAEGMYEGVVNANQLDRFRPIAKEALTRVIREIVRRSIRAMEEEAARPGSQPAAQPPPVKAAPTRPADEPGAQKDPVETDDGEKERRGIATTENELRLFALVKGQFERSALVNAQVYDSAVRKDVPLLLAHKDTTGYFGIFFNKPSWWIMRACLDARLPWVGFDIDEVVGAALVPEGMARLDPQSLANFRVQITGPEDIDKLHRLVFAAFEKTVRDHSKTTEAGQAEKSPEAGAQGWGVALPATALVAIVAVLRSP